MLDDVAVAAGSLLGDGSTRGVLAVRLARRGSAGARWRSARAQAVLDYVIPYVKDRTAFGEPISNRQAVAFTVAEHRDRARRHAAGLHIAPPRAPTQGLDFAREATLARRLCSERGMQIGSDGVQLLGGHGYVKEHPVERWYRDLRAAGVMEGVLVV